MKFYEDVFNRFISQDYKNLYPTDLITYHYSWWRPGKFLDLRCEQLVRPAGYWEAFKNAINMANRCEMDEINNRPSVSTSKDNITAWIKKIKIEHPIHIRGHECFLKNI